MHSLQQQTNFPQPPSAAAGGGCLILTVIQVEELNRYPEGLADHAIFLNRNSIDSVEHAVNFLLRPTALVNNNLLPNAVCTDICKDIVSNNLNVRGLRYSNFGVDCQMEVAFGFAVDTDGFMVVYTADYLL